MVAWFVFIQLTCNFKYRCFWGETRSPYHPTPWGKWIFWAKERLKLDCQYQQWCTTQHFFKGMSSVWGSQILSQRWVSLLGGVNALAPGDHLPCLYQTQICWSTYSAILWQDRLHHLNPKRVCGPKSMSVRDHPLRACYKDQRRAFRNENQSVIKYGNLDTVLSKLPLRWRRVFSILPSIS